MNVILRDLDQTRVHFEAAIHRVGEQAAARAFTGPGMCPRVGCGW